MCGNRKTIILIALIIFGLLAFRACEACPACLPAGNEKNLNLSIAALFVLGTIPLLVFGFVAWRIVVMQNHERLHHQN